MTVEDDEPEDCDDDGIDQSRMHHEEVIEEDVDNHGAEEDKGKRDVAVYQEQEAADNLNCRDEQYVVGLKHCADELASGSGRQLPHGNEVEETVGAEDDEDEAQQDCARSSLRFSLTLLAA